jgi:hypothetical protein
MIFLKSVIAGIIAIVMAIVLTVIVVVADIVRQARQLPPGVSVGWDPVSLFHNLAGNPLAWAFLVFAFTAGFFHEFRVLRLKG